MRQANFSRNASDPVTTSVGLTHLAVCKETMEVKISLLVEVQRYPTRESKCINANHCQCISGMNTHFLLENHSMATSGEISEGEIEWGLGSVDIIDLVRNTGVLKCQRTNQYFNLNSENILKRK
jgi:hypothetical protein